ncbi:ABC transporter ATP-binding protein [Salinispora vitiensis]|uniref:ABC transporter ATP-binding protein n=1 Tax=Salinispora vitiensis TaxID=999544 RepID=UPI0013A54C84|nr:ABC transporter ATP-binding protein [Salinispora vitiensis]
MQGTIPVAIAWLTKILIDGFQFPEESLNAFVVVGAITGFGVAAALLPYAVDYARGKLRRSIGVQVQERLFLAVNRFKGLQRFEDPAFLDRLRLADRAASTAPDQVFTQLLAGVQAVITLVGFLAILYVVSPIVMLITLVAAIPALFVQMSVSRRQASMMWRLSRRNRREMFYHTLMLDLAAVKEVRLFGLGPFLLERMQQETRSINFEENLHDRRVLVAQAPLALLSAVTAGVGLVWMVGLVRDGTARIGDLTAFIAAVAGTQAAVTALVSSISSGYASLLAFGHYLGVLNLKSDLPSPQTPSLLPKLSNGIRVEDVWFRYTAEGPWILRGVNLYIPHGQSLAVVGLNGAGKSTLVKLLCRLYDPTKGRITWDGVDIADVDISVLRERIGAIFQDYMAYDLSASENIGIGDVKDRHDRSRVVLASTRAGADEFISQLPEGYDSMLSRVFFQGDGEDSQHGKALSGGQWQRVALARGLMRSSRDLLILDEPSAGLDPAAEQAVHEKLRHHRLGSTSILISHRLGAVRHAQHIAVLQDGRILEEGSHEKLIAHAGEYARLFAAQASGYLQTDSGIPRVEGASFHG